MSIRDWRAKIDEIDSELVKLLNLRAACVLEIAKLKKAHGLPIHEPEREQEIFRNVAEANGGPLTQAALKRLFERIIDEGRSMQRQPMGPENGREEGPAVDTELHQPDKD